MFDQALRATGMGRIVQKFGGTSVADVERIREAARNGTVLLLPIPVFMMGYAACFVEQLDEEYRIFEEPLTSPQG